MSKKLKPDDDRGRDDDESDVDEKVSYD